MKKIVLFLLLAAMFCVSFAYALDSKILNTRDALIKESADIKALLTTKTKDPVIISGLFNTCLITATQLDAYFLMLGIFEAAKKEGCPGNEGIKFIVSWLNEIRNTSTLNIENINAITQAEPKTKVEIGKLRATLISLSALIDIELNKFSIIAQSAKKTKK